MAIIGFFGAPDDQAYLPAFQAIVGAHALKVSLRPEEYLTSIAAKARATGLTDLITTDITTTTTLLKAIPDFRHPINKNGALKKLSIDDYAGSCFVLPAAKLGTAHDVRVLILNPLAHLRTTDTGRFIFERFISKITKPARWFPQTRFTWETWTPANSAALLAKFSSAKLLAVDIETWVDDPERRIRCVGYCALFADGSTHSVVVPFRSMLAHAFVRALNATSVAKILQNGMYDHAYFARWNCVCTNYLYDTQHLFHSWYSELPKRLDFITAFAVRDIRYWKDDSAGGEWELFEYNARDCWATLTAWCSLMVEVPQWALDNYLIEFPLVFPCLHTELDGLALNKGRFDAKQAEAQTKLSAHAATLATWFGEAFNPGSSQQCERVLTVLGMKDVDGADAKALNNAAAASPFNTRIVDEILAYRKQAKLLSTYFKWDKFWNGRLYYRTNPAGTDTGRLASTESSYWTGLQIQNIPASGGVRAYIIPDAGWLIAENDYSQSEARCVAYMSGCTSLIDLVESDRDYHSWNAHKFFGVPYEQVTKALRQLAKRVGHGANYCMGPGVLLETMGPKAVQEAKLLLKLPAAWTLHMVCQHLLRTYEQAYPEVKQDWYGALKREIMVTKKLRSPLGWTRFFFADPSKSKSAMNASVAHGPQNLSVQIINKCFYRIWRDSVYGDLQGRIRIKAQIHDSILYCYKDADIPGIVSARMAQPEKIKDCANVVRTMLIPNDSSTGGTSWQALK